MKQSIQGVECMNSKKAVSYALRHEEKIERYIDKKDRARNYLEYAVLLTVLSVVLAGLAFSNLKAMKPIAVIALVFVPAALYCFIKALLLRRWRFYLSENKVIFCTSLGGKATIPLSDLSGYKWGESGEIILYHDNKPVFVMDQLEESENIAFLLKISGVKNEGGSKNEFVITESNFEKGIACFCIFISLLILLVGLWGKCIPLVLPGIVFIICAIVHALRIFSNKITVADEQFSRKVIFGKSGVWTFKEIEKVKGLINKSNERYLFYVDGKVCFKVNLRSRNVARLRRLVEREGWFIGTYHG